MHRAPRALALAPRRAALSLCAAPALLAACADGGGQSAAPEPQPRPAAQAAAPAAPAISTEPDARGMMFMDGYVLAIARPGDTLGAIAARTGAEAEAIAAYNGLPSTYTPRAGDEIVLPPKIGGYTRLAAAPQGAMQTASPLSEPAPEPELIGESGFDAAYETGGFDAAADDGFGAAAEASATGWSASRIADAINRGEGAAPSALAQESAEIYGATETEGGRDIVYHTVAAGETVEQIAARYRIDPGVIAAWNALSGPNYRVSQGQVLTLPLDKAETVAGLGDAPVALPGEPGDMPPPRSAGTPLPADTPAATPLVSPDLSQYQQTTTRAASEAAAAEAAAAAARAAEAAAPAVEEIAAAEPAAPTTALLRPVPGPIVAPYNRDPGPDQNDGVDFDAAPGETVRAADDGEVALVSTSLGEWGSIVLLRHGSELMTVYGRMGAISVRKGQRVTRGQELGQVATPLGDAPARMHFEVRRGAFSEDPAKYF